MYIGIDIGTSGVKSILMDDHQNIIAQGTAPLFVSYPQQGYAEQDPQSWFKAVDIALLKLKEQAPTQMAEVKAMSFSGQMHGLVLVDQAGNVLRPAILWNDTRCGLECEELKAKEKGFISITGNEVMAGFTAPKLEWVRKNEPDIFKKIHKILLPKDYIRYCLTGLFISEKSDAAGTLWLDTAQRCWSEDLMKASHITYAHLPSLIEGTEVSGILFKKLQHKWGIKNDVKIIGGAGDNAAAACGLGAINPGDAFISLGTSGVVFITTDQLMPAAEQGAHAFCHALPNLWHQMAVTLAATDCINWLSDLLNQPVEQLMDGLGTLKDGPSDILFLPYLSGERTPINDPQARGAFINLARMHSSKDMARAVIEGVAFALHDGMNVLKQAGSIPKRLMVVGGGAQNKLWIEILSTLMGLDIDIPQTAHLGGALGAARLAMAGDRPDVSLQAIFKKPESYHTIHPDNLMQKIYQEQFIKFKQLYPAIKGVQ